MFEFVLSITLIQATLRPSPPGAPQAVIEEEAISEALFERGQLEMARWSDRAIVRRVPDAGHDILADRPDAILAAIPEVMAQVRE